MQWMEAMSRSTGGILSHDFLAGMYSNLTLELFSPLIKKNHTKSKSKKGR